MVAPAPWDTPAIAIKLNRSRDPNQLAKLIRDMTTGEAANEAPDAPANRSRRAFAGGLALAGTASLLGLRSRAEAAEPLPETTRLRLYKFPGTCIAPMYVGKELLRAEGFASWRQYNPEDALRFYALRLHEVGVIESTPKKLIAEHTNWRFLAQLKKEMKV